MGRGVALLLVLALLELASCVALSRPNGRVHVVNWARRGACSPRVNVFALVAEEDDDVDDDDDFDDEDSEDPFIDDVRDEDAEDIIFRFTADGKPKAWALKPHLKTMLEEVRSGRAMLLDVRNDAQWAKGHLEIATHCPLETLQAEGMSVSDLPLPKRKDTIIYVHSAFADEGKNGVKASLVLRALGYENTRYLKEVYEALNAQLQL